MARYEIDLENTSPGHLKADTRLEFGGLNVEYLARRNRFELSDPYRAGASVLLFESDIPAFVGFVLKHFVPFGPSIQRVDEDSKRAENAITAALLACEVFKQSRQWTSKHCIDCMGQRFRANRAQEVMNLISALDGGDPERARKLADSIDEYVLEERAKLRKEGFQG